MFVRPSVDINAIRFASAINIDLGPQQTLNTSNTHDRILVPLIITASNHVIRNIYNTTKMSTRDSHFRRVWGKFIQISSDAYTVLLVR